MKEKNGEKRIFLPAMVIQLTASNIKLGTLLQLLLQLGTNWPEGNEMVLETSEMVPVLL